MSTVNPRILAALNKADELYSTSKPVPSNNPTYKGYDPSKLASLKTRDDLYKTFEVGKGLYVNYGLRSFTENLIKNADPRNVRLVTFKLTNEFSAKLLEIDQQKLKKERTQGPIERLTNDLRRYVLDKLGITHYYYVLEKSPVGFHAHLVMDCMGVSDDQIKLQLAKKKWISSTTSSIQIQRDYWEILYRDIIGKAEADRIDLEIELYGDDSSWVCAEFKVDEKGNKVCRKYKSSQKKFIDSGLADYLAKGLRERLFKSARDNFSASKALRQRALKQEKFLP